MTEKLKIIDKNSNCRDPKKTNFFIPIPIGINFVELNPV
jgi:hypothetical protein